MPVYLAQTELGTGGLQAWMLSNIFPLLLLAVALLVLWLGGSKGDNAAVMRRLGGVFVALAVVGLAVSGAGIELGTWLAGLFTGGG
jgi:hypothetical protein